MAKRKGAELSESAKKARIQQDQLLAEPVFTRLRARAAESDDEEQDYERAPRSLKTPTGIDTLPIKRGGKVERVIRQLQAPADDSSDDEKGDGSDKKTANDADPDNRGAVFSTTSSTPDDSNLLPEERLQKAKTEIASLALDLLEDPEEHIDKLSRLRHLTLLDNAAVAQLALLALVPVFKALATAYKIRALSEAELKERVGRDVARLRHFEQKLVTNYRDYVAHLGRLARVLAANSQGSNKVTRQQVRLGELAAKAACELCSSSLRHFNYREELFSIPIRRLNRKPSVAADLDVFTRCVRTLEQLLAEDGHHGSITHDVVRILCKVIKDKQFRVDEAVVNVLLSTALLADYDPDHGNGDGKSSGQGHAKSKKKPHLSKKQKKARRELKEIDDEMRRAEQAVTAEERQRFQAQTLKLVLTLYLEILRAAARATGDPATMSAQRLTAAVMEGLSRFGHMLNFDLLGDFLVVLRETMTSIVEDRTLAGAESPVAKRERSKNGKNDHPEDSEDSEDPDDFEDGPGVYTADDVRKLLLCISAAFALVLNHGEVGRLPISFDLLAFVSTLYQVVGDVAVSPDLEFSHKSLRLADPLGVAQHAEKPAVNVSTNAELFVKSLDMVFFRSRNGSVARAMPFTKRLYMAALHAPEKTTIALLKFVAKLVNKYGNSLKGLWSTDDTVLGEGNYVLGYEKEGFEVDLERSNVGSAVLWENVLLDKHYSGIVRDGSRSLMKNSKDTSTR